MKRISAVFLAFGLVVVGATLPAYAMPIFVEISGGRSVIIDVEPSDSIESVKSLIQDKEGILPSDQTLIFAGITLLEGRTLSDYNIQRSSTIQLIIRVDTGYQGPVFEGLSGLDALIGSRVTLTGVSLATISLIEIAGVTVGGLVVSDTQVSFTVPEVPPGLQNLKVTSGFGQLIVQGALVARAAAVIASSWTKKLATSSAKLYAKNIIGAGKVQFFFNGKEIAWVRASDAFDSKLRLITEGPMAGANYLVRTVNLVKGEKNVLEVYVDGVRTTRTAYSY